MVLLQQCMEFVGIQNDEILALTAMARDAMRELCMTAPLSERRAWGGGCVSPVPLESFWPFAVIGIVEQRHDTLSRSLQCIQRERGGLNLGTEPE